MVEAKSSMISRKTLRNPEVKKQLKEIKKLQKELELKQRDYERKVTLDESITSKICAAREAQVTKERAKARKELSKQINATLKKEAKEKKLQEKIAIKEGSIQEKARLKEEKRLKVVAAKESKYKEKIAKRENLKSKINNLIIIAKKTTLIGLLAGSIYLVYDSNIVQNSIADYKQKKLIEQSTDDYIEDIIPDNEEEIVEEVPVEEMPHEVISTELYDSGYEFDSEVTPEVLNGINPILSDNTCWICIPGTNINYPVVHPSVDNVDQVEGLRSEIEKSGDSDDIYMNKYYLHKNMTDNKSSQGTLFLDLYNNSLNRPSVELSDMNVIYGHKMKSNSMFSQLHNWKYDATGAYNAEHPFGIIYTNDGYGYKVTFITSRVISGESNSVLHLNNFNSYEDKCEYIESIMDDAKQHGWFTLDDYQVEEDDKFMCLTTCSYDNQNDRYQLIGVLEKIKIRENAYNANGYYVEEESTLHR